MRLADIEGLTFFCSEQNEEQAMAMLLSLQAGGGTSKRRLIKGLLGARCKSPSSTWELGYLFTIGFGGGAKKDIVEVTFPGGRSSMKVHGNEERAWIG